MRLRIPIDKITVCCATVLDILVAFWHCSLAEWKHFFVCGCPPVLFLVVYLAVKSGMFSGVFPLVGQWEAGISWI
jgi:hypothetical protein